MRDRKRARAFLRRLPRRSNASRYPVLRYVAPFLKERNYLWSWKQAHVRRAYYLGWVITLMPLFGAQILAATGLAVLFKANVTVAAALQFVSNPLTAAPILYLTYQSGKAILSFIGIGLPGPFTGITANLFVGGAACGLACALLTDIVSYTWRRLRSERSISAIPHRAESKRYGEGQTK